MSDLCTPLENHHLMPLGVAVNTACLEQLLKDKIAESSALLEQLIEDKLKMAGNYELCEFYYFRNPTLKPGFQPAQGGLLANAAALYPAAWEYLQTAEGQKLCTTEPEWQAMTKATWATLADGTRIGWDGIGGAPFYAPDYATGSLRLPDLRGMYAEAAGYDALEVGGVHGDAVREVTGKLGMLYGGASGDGVFVHDSMKYNNVGLGGGASAAGYVKFASSRIVPTAAKNQPRAWGALACVYLGAPK